MGRMVLPVPGDLLSLGPACVFGWTDGCSLHGQLGVHVHPLHRGRSCWERLLETAALSQGRYLQDPREDPLGLSLALFIL